MNKYSVFFTQETLSIKANVFVHLKSGEETFAL